MKADTIEEFAQKLQLPVETLKATIARNNELYKKGEDVDYGKEAHRLSPIDKAPFYGAKNTGWLLCTLDGIQINTDMNAIDTEGNPIPGLYVVGNDSGSYFANEYPNLATGMACGDLWSHRRSQPRQSESLSNDLVPSRDPYFTTRRDGSGAWISGNALIFLDL